VRQTNISGSFGLDLLRVLNVQDVGLAHGAKAFGQLRLEGGVMLIGTATEFRAFSRRDRTCRSHSVIVPCLAVRGFRRAWGPLRGFGPLLHCLVSCTEWPASCMLGHLEV
jgi:hypothetical protein